MSGPIMCKSDMSIGQVSFIKLVKFYVGSGLNN